MNHIIIQAWKRPECTRRTMETLLQHNDLEQFTLWSLLDGGYDPRVKAILRGYGCRELVHEDERQGVRGSIVDAAQEIIERGAPDDTVILLQNDWECVRPIPWGWIQWALGRDCFSTYWLFGREKQRDGGYPMCDVNLGRPGRPALEWEEVETPYAGTVHRVEGWLNLPPSATCVDVWADVLIRGARHNGKDSYGFRRASGELPMIVYWQPDDPVFYHIGHHSTRKNGPTEPGR